MWACSICAASFENKQWATRHTIMQHIISQGARVVFDPNGTIGPTATPTPHIKTYTLEEENINKTVNKMFNPYEDDYPNEHTFHVRLRILGLIVL